MIEPVKMKHQNATNFSGVKKSFHDPLNARKAYSNVLNDNKDVLHNESLKVSKSTPFKKGETIDFKG